MLPLLFVNIVLRADTHHTTGYPVAPAQAARYQPNAWKDQSLGRQQLTLSFPRLYLPLELLREESN